MQYFDRNANEFEDEPHLLDDDGPDDEADESEPTIACPYCRQEIYEDAHRRPHCERYISEDDLRKKKSWLIIIGTSVPVHRLSWIAG